VAKPARPALGSSPAGGRAADRDLADVGEGFSATSDRFRRSRKGRCGVVELLAVLAGLVLLAVLVVDVFGTVFVPRGGAGFVTGRLYRLIWGGWTRAAGRAGRHRRSVLPLAGPVLLPLTVAVWVAELVAGFALVYLPVLEQFSVPQPGAAGTWATSVYVSAYSATTLGVGDIYASTTWLRLLITLEAGLGFALFSISITYVLSVYGALLRATALALQIATFIGRQAGDDAIDVVSGTSVPQRAAADGVAAKHRGRAGGHRAGAGAVPAHRLLPHPPR
jgi:hypothetical protein